MTQGLPLRAIGLVLLGVALVTRLCAATAEDFGFGTMRVNGRPAIGTLPLLVVTYELPTNGTPMVPLRSDASNFFHRLVFDIFSFPSINGFFRENSYGSFYWQRAGVIGPVRLNASETATLNAKQSIDFGDGVTRFGLDCGAGMAYMVELIAAKTGYDFRQWNANGDGFITQDELSLMIIGNLNGRSGANRPIGPAGAGQSIEGQNLTIYGDIASLGHFTTFATFTHELAHSLGTVDLYSTNSFSCRLTLMSCTTLGGDNDPSTMHLDPWHKMLLGWLRPRILTVASDGLATIHASQFASADTPLLFYDPARGANEYFMVEFRNNQASGGGADHDRNAAGPPGLAIWHYTGGNPVIFHRNPPTLSPGPSSVLWAPGQTTPTLRWVSGGSSLLELTPVSIINGGRDLVVNWNTRGDTWVDFSYFGPEFGTFTQPFNALSEGIAAVIHGGTVAIKRGSSSERPRITKPLTLQAYDGPATIGR